MARTRSSKTQKSKDINPKTAEQKAETGTKRKSIGKTSLEGKRRRIQKITKEQGRKETKVASTRGTRSKKAEVENKSEARVTSKKAAASAAPQFKSTGKGTCPLEATALKATNTRKFPFHTNVFSMSKFLPRWIFHIGKRLLQQSFHSSDKNSLLDNRYLHATQTY